MGTTWRNHHTLNQRHQIQFYSTTISLCEGALIRGWASLLIVRFQRNFVWGSRTACWQGLRDKIMQMCKIQDGGRPPFWKSLNHHILVKNRPILMKFGTLHQILNPVTVTWPKIAIFKIQDGGGRHLEIRFLAITQRTVVRFQWNFVRGNRMAGRQGLHDKNCNFF